ncbi:MAG: phosphoribosylformylglycinamidine cyclo-ligase [Spirochaetia bacterium]
MQRPSNYEDAGVSIDRGDDFADFVKAFPSDSVSNAIGSFAGGISLDHVQHYKNPVLLSTTDGVGTKLLVAQRLKKYDTIGIDLVAMSVNDLAVCGANPLSFLDYIACSRIDGNVLKPLITGIIRGCEIAGATLTGGETAEMPGLYRPGDFDLAGFCTGIAEKEKMLPKSDSINAGDKIYGLPSAGIHSNGLSLARKILEQEDDSVWEMLLTPTLIYVRELEHLSRLELMKGAAHITGGGLRGNIARIIPNTLSFKLKWNWDVPEIFELIQEKGDVGIDEMRRAFNMGIGIAFIAEPERSQEIAEAAHALNTTILEIGEVVSG